MSRMSACASIWSTDRRGWRRATGNRRGSRRRCCSGVRHAETHAVQQRIHLSQPTISHHMAILEKAGLVEAEKEGHWRWYQRKERTIKQYAKVLRQTL